MDVNQPKISVIVPVYKAEAYLHRCVDSLLAQTFQDFEILLIDDGSPDRSGEICDEYARRSKKIKVIHNPNQGVVAARASGVKKSSGEWFTFVDSDDFLQIDGLEKLLRASFSVDTNIVIGYSNMLPISEQILLSVNDYRKECILGTLRAASSLWAKLFHKSLLKDDSVLMLPRDIIQGEDMLINIKLAFYNEKPIVLIPYSIYHYNTENVMSCMHTFVPTIDYIEKFHDLLYHFIPQNERCNYQKELLRAQINSLHFLTIRGSCSWKKSLFYKRIKVQSNKMNLTFRDYFLLEMPYLYMNVYKVLKSIISK